MTALTLCNRPSHPLSVSSVAVAAVTWLKDGGPVRTGPGLQQRQDGTRLTLTVERVRRVDQGTYRCQLITADGLTVTSATWTLSVHGKTFLPVNERTSFTFQFSFIGMTVKKQYYQSYK